MTESRVMPAGRDVTVVKTVRFDMIAQSSTVS
jgi:hypothetical protein